jgi:hypothetical protein
MSGFDASDEYFGTTISRMKFIELSELIMQKYGTILKIFQIRKLSINHTEASTREKFLYDKQFLDSNRHIGLVSFPRTEHQKKVIFPSAKSLNFLGCY